MFKAYYYLTKPGIIYGNLLTTAAGFFLASAAQPNYITFLGVMIGTGCIIACACVCNNFLDRGIDAMMERTKRRSLVTGKIPISHAFLFALLLGFVGILSLFFLTNLLTLLVGLIGFVDYVLVYGFYKRRSIHGTMIGGISGATPILAGYTAVTNSFDIAALFLFLTLLFWQMPHFFAVAIYRIKDYAAASIPVFPIERGEGLTKVHMLVYLCGYICTTLLLPLFSNVGIMYVIVMILTHGYWIWITLNGFLRDDDKWAKKMFHVSLLSLTIFSLLLIGSGILP